MKKLIALLCVMTLLCGGAMAQNKKGTKTVTINIPAYCCNGLTPTIENTLAYEKGVVEWKCDKDHKCVTVTYKEGKTTPDTIEKALATNGVRTEHYRPTDKAIAGLPKCCQPAAKGQGSCATK